MSKSNRPSKPRPDFPLFPHASGRWAKKVRGSFCYFGKVVDDPKGEKALALWLDQRDDLLAGRKPRAKVENITVEDLVNAWLDAKHKRLESGELSPLTWRGYKHLAGIVVEALGRTRSAADIGPDDFANLRATFAKRWGPAKLATAITHTRAVFKWGYQAALLATPQRFGDDFGKPSAKTIRTARNQSGPRMFQQAELLAILDAAEVNARAMILLGVQAGIGNTDLALLPVSALDLQAGWLTLPRAKTGIPRRIPLWPETVDAIKVVLDQRPAPKRGNEDYLFLAPNGTNYVCNRYGTEVSKLFQRTAHKAGVTGRTFYDLRRTFATVADGAKDPVATSAIMGHAPNAGDMSAVYRQAVADDRLRAVVTVVHDWLFSDPKPVDSGPGDGDRQHGQEGTQQATESTRVQLAIVRCLRAIEAAEGPDRAVLQSVWNSSEIALALSGDTWTVKRFIETWGDDQEPRPALRIVG